MDGSQPLWFRHRAEPRLDLRSRRGQDVPQDPMLTSALGLMCLSAITLLRVSIRFARGPRIFILHRAHGLGSRYCSRAALLCLGHPPWSPPDYLPPLWALPSTTVTTTPGTPPRQCWDQTQIHFYWKLLLEKKQGSFQWLLGALPVYPVFVSFKPCRMKMGISNKIPKYVWSPQLSSCSWFSQTGPPLIDFLMTEEHVRWVPGFR